MWKSFLISSFFSILSIYVSGQTKNTPSKKLEAVCIVGSDVRESYETRTEEISAYLESQNIKVHRFYEGNNNWEEIKKAAENCTFLIYSGHGTHLGLDGGFGGMVVDDFISAEQIMNELRFKKDAIVVYQSACGGAGSSAGDQGDIGLKTAESRIVGTATPFLLSGAKAYYANNYYGGALNFVKGMLEGKSVHESFINTAQTWTRIEKNQAYSDKRLSAINHIGITSENDYNKSSSKRKSYSIAYVGIPTFKINEAAILSKK
jgi:hypothetical protein